jgi:hypothetical protein
MPQQPGWGQQPGWAPPAPKSQSAASSNRPFLVILLFVLLIGLGFLTYKYTPIGETLLNFFNSSTGGGGSTTTDTTKPTITNTTSNVGVGGVAINWKTNELASSQVEYGKTTAYGSVYPEVAADDPTGTESLGVVEHSVTIPAASLEEGATYHFRVKSKDKAGNEAVSTSDATFTTLVITE